MILYGIEKNTKKIYNDLVTICRVEIKALKA